MTIEEKEDEEKEESPPYDWSSTNFLRNPKNEAYKYAFMHVDDDD